jgi:hypothetical protein
MVIVKKAMRIPASTPSSARLDFNLPTIFWTFSHIQSCQNANFNYYYTIKREIATLKTKQQTCQTFG